MNRKEIGAYINKHGLGQKVKDTFGDNWTRVATDKLEKLINEHMGFGGKAEDKKPAKKTEKSSVNKPAPKTTVENKPVTKSEPASQATSTDNPLEAACLVFLGLLKDAGLLDGLLKKL